MAQLYSALTPELSDFIQQQHIYFVGTAGASGKVNVSPKGMGSLRILGPERVVWLNLTGSGNESAAHVRENGRMTLMFCSFDKQPMILRLYGQARVVHPRDGEWAQLQERFPPLHGTRQFFVLDIELVQTSCGFAVPFMEFTGDRPTLENWAAKKGRDGLHDYWGQKNLMSLDNLETGILD